MRQYQYQLAQRERNWMQTLGVTAIERVQYEQGLDASNVGLQNFYGDLQEKYGDLIGEFRQQDEALYKEYAQKGEGAKLAAEGRTGRSAQRIAKLDYAQYMAAGSRAAYQLTKVQRKFSRAASEKAAATRAQQMNMFAQNAIVKSPDLAPPRPVLQNVGQAAFMDALSIAGSVASIYSGVGGVDVGGGQNLWGGQIG